MVKICEPVQEWSTSYTYTLCLRKGQAYDPLYRLTGADYSTGEFFNYSYDAVGNRLSETTETGTTTYTYDIANRLIDVGGVTYTWDNNGNLLNDGVNTYILCLRKGQAYNHANRLVAVVGSSTTSSYGYNGLGDRLQQTVDSVTEDYTLDLNDWLTQVLADGTNTYLYGNGRIAQHDVAGPEYLLSDALGSVRQLTDSGGTVTLAKTYQPFGQVMQSVGSGSSPYGFTNEWTDGIGLLYLRARYYNPYLNQFIQPDPIVSDYSSPQNLNAYSYVLNNPVNLTDPSGLIPIIPQEPPDHRDLTYWLYEEMHANANGYYVQRILSLLNSSNLTYKARAVLGWIFLVKENAKWDSKHRIKDVMEGDESILLRSNEGFSWYEYSVPGNIHYGFVGRASGFSGFMLHAGAGYAEIIDSVHKERGEACCPKICIDLIDDPWINLIVCPRLGCYYINPDWADTLFDDPGDYWNVEFGVKLYDTYRSGMTFGQFQHHLAAYGWWLTPASAVPASRFEHTDWPYWAGFFDGPHTKKINLLSTYFCGGPHLETSGRLKASYLTLCLILVFLLGMGLGGCGGVYLEFNTPDVPPAPCPIQELILERSVFPGDEWEETGSRSENAAPVRMGIERIGTGFSTPNGGAFQEIYRFEGERKARRAYKGSAESWFTPAEHRTEWVTPEEFENLVQSADQYRVGCNDRKLGSREQCQYVAQYDPYIIRFFAGMRALSYEDFIELVNDIDQRATNCLE